MENFVNLFSKSSVEENFQKFAYKKYGKTLSNYSLNNYTDVGFKLGIPISGTGIDINWLLMKKDRWWDMLNLAYSISPNSSLDLTY